MMTINMLSLTHMFTHCRKNSSPIADQISDGKPEASKKISNCKPPLDMRIIWPQNTTNYSKVTWVSQAWFRTSVDNSDPPPPNTDFHQYRKSMRILVNLTCHDNINIPPDVITTLACVFNAAVERETGGYSRWEISISAASLSCPLRRRGPQQSRPKDT